MSFKSESEPPFANGFWIWNDITNGLEFISRAVKEQDVGKLVSSTPAAKDNISSITFKDTIDDLAQAQFRRHFQRRIKPNQIQIVTIQDIKDVALYTAKRSDLKPEFVQFMHTRKMDEFLRSLIVYFQYYFTVWDNMIQRREESRRKLRQPLVTILENKVRDNLADLRSMVGRNYGYVILGLDDTLRYYHMSNNNVSLSDKDRHLHECLLSITTKIVWIGLLRKNFVVIETELNRLFRSKIFNIMGRLRTVNFITNAEEDRVLLGKGHKVEKKLKHRSPVIQELIFDDHNFKMLAIGQLTVEPIDERAAYFEAAYTAPEELLFTIQIGVGILGLAKSFLTPTLSPKEGMAKRIKLPPFVPPEQKPMIGKVFENFPELPPKYTETDQSKQDRKMQCELWRRYTLGIKMTKPADAITISSLSTSAE